MKYNDLSEQLLSSSSSTPNHNYQSLDSYTMNDSQHTDEKEQLALQEEDEQISPLSYKSPKPRSKLRMERIPSEESVTAAISLSSGSIPTNTNVISALRAKAASNAHAPKVDNVFLYRSIPKFGDMFLDNKTSAITLVHSGFVLLTIVLITLAYTLNIETPWRYGTYLCLLTNIFGVAHSMYGGSISSKLSRLDAALQNFAVIIQKFAKALNIQETYLGTVKHILDFLDHHILLLEYEHPEIAALLSDDDKDNKDDTDYKALLLIYHELFCKIKEQSVIQHKKWLLTFFGQYKLLDNRFGITKVEYLDFIRKLPNKSRTFFQSLTGIHTRFKQLNTSDSLNQPPSMMKHSDAKPEPLQGTHHQSSAEHKDTEEKDLVEMFKKKQMSIHVDLNRGYKTTDALDQQLGDDTVLLYKDMTELVYKVLSDIERMNRDIEKQLAVKMLYYEREKEKEKEYRKAQAQSDQFMLSSRMSVSLAHDAPNVTIGAKNIKQVSEMKPMDANKYVKMENNGNHTDSEEAHYDAKTANLAVVNLSDPKSAPLMHKIQSYEGMDIVKQRTLSMDEEWLKKVMDDLNDDDDDNYYDCSHDHSHVSNKL
eukprot:98619_1